MYRYAMLAWLNVKRCMRETAAVEKDEVFQEEQIIRKQTARITGFRGNPAYAAELGLIPVSDITAPAAAGICHSSHHRHHLYHCGESWRYIMFKG